MYTIRNQGLLVKVKDFLEEREQQRIAESVPVTIVSAKERDPFMVRMQDRWLMRDFPLKEGFDRIFVNGLDPEDFYNVIHDAHKADLLCSTEVTEVIKHGIPDEALRFLVLSNLTDVGNYFNIISVPNEVPVLKYVPAGKYNRSLKAWPDDVQTVKKNVTSVIRFALKRVDMTLTDKQIEDIANLVKAYYLNNELEVIEVKGPDIQQYYHVSSHYTGVSLGDLANSCMRYDECRSFFGLYTDNPDTISLLVARYRGKGMVGRALVWNLDNGARANDRIYGSDATKAVISRYCSDNDIKNKAYLEAHGQATVANYEFAKYPFLDTMYYSNPETKMFMSATMYNRETIGYNFRFHRVANGGWQNV